MELIGVIVKVGDARELDGAQGKIKMVDVVVNAGTDHLVATAFEKTAELITHPDFKPWSLMKMRLTTQVREKDGKLFNSIRLEAFGYLTKQENDMY